MIKLYIVTYKKNDVLNQNLRTLWATVRRPERLDVTIISNHPDVVVEAENQRPNLRVLLNSTRSRNSWGYLSRDWNFAIQDAFVNWRNPHQTDWCVLAQNDVEWINGWDEWLDANDAFDFVTQPVGDQCVALNIAAVRRVGFYDERFTTLHFHEFDYFLRAMLTLGERASINDTHGGDAGASWNPVGCVLTQEAASGFDEGDDGTLHTRRSYAELRNLLFSKWNVENLDAVENKAALVRARRQAKAVHPREVNWNPFFWDEASPSDAPAITHFLPDYEEVAALLQERRGWRALPGRAASGAKEEAPRIAVVLQGPLVASLNGHSTAEILDSLSRFPLRHRLHVTLSLWEDEALPLADFAPYVDQIVLSHKPARKGASNRAYQAHGVTCAMEALQALPNPPLCALKTRPDIFLSHRFLQKIVDHADNVDMTGKFLVTNLFTRLESFHIADMVVFSTVENLLLWFDNADTVYYEDLFAPEVQFARTFIRNRKLAYSHRLEDYLRFLRDWIILVDFADEGLIWFKDPNFTSKAHNKIFGSLYDRDVGPVLARLITVRFHQRLCRAPGGLRMLAAYFLISDIAMRTAVGFLPVFRRRRHTFTLLLNQGEHDKPVPGGKGERMRAAPLSAPPPSETNALAAQTVRDVAPLPAGRVTLP